MVVARLMTVIKNITADLELPLKCSVCHFCSYITGQDKSCGQADFKEAQIYNLPMERGTSKGGMDILNKNTIYHRSSKS